MPVVYLTRVERFNAAHKLYNKNWSEEKNIEIFGKCANKNWHGHNYRLFVTVKGEPDPNTGFIIDAKKLSSIIMTEVVDKLDHQNLNLDVDFIPDNIMPTTENLAILIWKQLESKLLAGKLHCIKVEETENIFVEYFGE
jgi:6-pyruvoyltetrahydropterin/6-carboxytetrahydropterin synthase